MSHECPKAQVVCTMTEAIQKQSAACIVDSITVVIIGNVLLTQI